MNLYLISQDINDDYDTYDSVIVCAKTEKEARHIRPGSGEYSWCKPVYVTVKKIGVAAASVERGIVLASFNAG